VVSGPFYQNHIRYNKVFSNNLSGLFCEKSENQKWYYNLSYNNGQHGIRVDADDGSYPVAFNEFYNNTCFSNGGSGIYCAGGYLQRQYSVGYNIFKNNISTANQTRQLTAKWGGENDRNLGRNNLYQYNCFGAENKNFIEWGNRTILSTYAEWQALYDKKILAIRSDPLFIDPLKDNFSLRSTSRCIDSGAGVFLDKDLLGVPIPVGKEIDIGAFEYNVTLLPPKGLCIKH
jgi:hypothetical protein